VLFFAFKRQPADS